jgi:hypothetical protein
MKRYLITTNGSICVWEARSRSDVERPLQSDLTLLRFPRSTLLGAQKAACGALVNDCGFAQAPGDIGIATAIGLEACDPRELLVINGVTPWFHLVRDSMTLALTKRIRDSLSDFGTGGGSLPRKPLAKRQFDIAPTRNKGGPCSQEAMWLYTAPTHY